MLCNKWVHKRCSGIVGGLKNCMDYHCRRCTGVLRDQEVDEKDIVIDAYTGDKIECVDKFSYLEDVLGKGGVQRRLPEIGSNVHGQSLMNLLHF